MPFTLRSFRQGFMYMARDLAGFFVYMLPWIVFTGAILKLGYVYGYQDRLMLVVIFFVAVPLVLVFPRLGYRLGLYRSGEVIRRPELVRAVLGALMLAVFINLGCNPWLP